jgi:hypothetical protein
MLNDDEEIRTFVLRYQKVLSTLKRKLNNLSQIKKGFIEEETQSHATDEEDEDFGLLDNMKLEVIPSYLFSFLEL